MSDAVDSASVKLLNVGAYCTDGERREVNDMNTYKIVWNSVDIPDRCRFKFSANSAVLRDDFKVCVEPTYYNLKDCNIQLSYYLGFDSYPENTFSCDDNPNKICGRIGEYFDIEITKKNSRLPISTGSSFTLEISALQVYDHSDRQGLIGGIIGGVIGVIALIVIVGVILILCHRRKRKRSENNYINRGYTNNAMDRTPEHRKTNGLDPKPKNPKPQPTHYDNIQNYGYRRDKSELTTGPIELEPGEYMI